MPDNCAHHSASVLGGSVYIVGAGNDHGVLCFDLTSEVWSNLSPTSVTREYGASFVACGFLYAVGGLGSQSSMERYNVATDTWTAVADMNRGRDTFGAVAIGSAAPAEKQDLFDARIAKVEVRACEVQL